MIQLITTTPIHHHHPHLSSPPIWFSSAPPTFSSLTPPTLRLSSIRSSSVSPRRCLSPLSRSLLLISSSLRLILLLRCSVLLAARRHFLVLLHLCSKSWVSVFFVDLNSWVSTFGLLRSKFSNF